MVQPKKTQARKKQLKSYASTPIEETVIRGHKLYWHQGDVSIKEISASKEDVDGAKSQYTEITPIKTGVSFGFDIHFENLTDVELGALMWVLNIAQSEKYRLSLGMGKPLGMGAVKVESSLYLENKQIRYQTLFEESGWSNGCKSETTLPADYIKAFEKYMRAQLSYQGKFTQQERIKMLLAMLSWESNLSETDTAQRKYMSLQQFKQRPVLPSPLDVEVNNKAIEQKTGKTELELAFEKFQRSQQ